MEYIIRSNQIFTHTGVLDGCVRVGDGIIKHIDDGQSTAGQVIDLRSYTVLPGLIDIHLHGGMGHDVMGDSADEILALARCKMLEGVTSFCPSTVTTSLERVRSVLANIRDAMARNTDGAKIIGAFLEGPYLCEKYRGAHAAEFLRGVSVPELAELLDEFPGIIKSVAIAPELENAPSAIRFLTERGVNVRIGHSNASCEQANKAIECGANVAIHTYNAMSPLTHREPGMVGAALSNQDIYCELICDFIHVSETACEIVIKCKGADKLVLITDCLSTGGLPDGDYRLGELKIIVKDGVARTETGALAGSSIKLIQAVKNICERLSVSLADAVKMASLTPARAMKIDNMTGSIEPGKAADIIAIDEKFNVVFIMIDGVVMLQP